jgi:hypothetical protein
MLRFVQGGRHFLYANLNFDSTAPFDLFPDCSGNPSSLAEPGDLCISDPMSPVDKTTCWHDAGERYDLL